MEKMSSGKKPEIRPKPQIASKPKFVPPVNLKVIPKSDLRISENQNFGNSSKIGVSHNKGSIRPKNGVELSKNQAPNSPSTICCSILSNSSDCCNIMGHKKEFDNKISKIDSLDSNSSDSGGFRDFIQPEVVKKLPEVERKIDGHTRNFSQPDYFEKSVSERAKCLLGKGTKRISEKTPFFDCGTKITKRSTLGFLFNETHFAEPIFTL